MDQTNGQMATQNIRSCGKLLQQTSNTLKALPASRWVGGWGDPRRPAITGPVGQAAAVGGGL